MNNAFAYLGALVTLSFTILVLRAIEKGYDVIGISFNPDKWLEMKFERQKRLS